MKSHFLSYFCSLNNWFRNARNTCSLFFWLTCIATSLASVASESGLNKPFLSFFHIGMDLSWPTIYQFPIILLGLMCCLCVQTGPKHNITSVLPYKLYLRWSVKFTANFSFCLIWLMSVSYTLLETGAVGVIEQYLVLSNKHTNSNNFNLMRFCFIHFCVYKYIWTS